MFNMLLLLLITSNVLCQKFISTSKDMKEVETVKIEGAQGNYANSAYLNERLIPSDQFTAIASSERDDYPFTNAFNGKDESYWVAKDINTEAFKNYITIRFKSTQKIEAILYYVAYATKDGKRIYNGMPQILTVYTSIGNEEFKPAYVFTGGEHHWPHLRIQFVFPQYIICDKLKIEFTDITNFEQFGINELVPSCGEMSFISKLTDEYLDIQKQINELFTDYSQFELAPTITTEKISELREKASKIDNYEKNLKPILDRAEAVLKGIIKKDPHREFSTKPGSKNQLEQNGDSISYIRNTIKFQKYGCNSQIIGIGGNSDKPITVFVDVEPLEGVQRSEVKLPTIKFTQINGTWESSFQTKELKLGRNDFIFYNFVKNHESYEKLQYLRPGGPIHVENPYTLEEQKGHVTLYFEQGYVYPVFRSGDDEEKFKIILRDYYNRLNDPNDDEITISAFELFSNHFIASAGVELAYKAYVVNNLSPQKNLDKWDDYLKELLRFSGVTFNPGDKYYDIKNEYVRENYRSTQEWAGSFAFAASNMVGLPYESSQQQLVNLNNPGWAMAHETGHALDKMGRIWSENTNNMWSMHNLIRMDNDVNDKLSISQVTERLSSDFSDYVTHKNGNIVHCSNPVVWWILEGAIPGYWGTSENMYCYETSDLNEKKNSILQVCERNIYYACLATKKNLCAYFERFGFYFKGDQTFGNADNLWTYEKSTDNFKNLLQKAISDGRVVDECPKYWYVNLEHYRVMNKHDNVLGDWATCYSSDDIIRPVSIQKLQNYYSLTLPEVKNPEAHLCYEIQSFIDGKWQVVGSTYSQFFNDDYPYANDFKPKYRIIGYDRNFHTSKALDDTDETITDAIENVARIGEKYYTTLQAAIDDVKLEDEIIYILKSFSATSIVFNFNKITIKPDPSLTEPIIISKAGTGNLINNGGKCSKLYFGDKNGVEIIFDGNNIRNKGNFINGGFNNAYFYNCIFRNNHNEEDGGAFYIGWDCRTHLENSVIEGCSAKRGGAVFTTGGYQGVYDSKIELLNSTIRNCVASDDGGAIYGSAINGWNNIIIWQNSVIENNEAQNGGAISFICYCSIRNSIIRNNKAHINGGAIFFNKEKERNCLCEIDHSTLENNIADETGYTLYIREPKTELHLNGGKIYGNIYKATDSLIFLQKHKDPQEVPDFSASKFFLDIPKDGVGLIDRINNYNVDSIVDQINVFNGYAMKENEIIKACPNRCNLKISFNGQIINYEINHGIFIFPNTFEGLNEDYYITEWTSDGKTYQIGDELNIVTDMEFSINTKLYFKLTFKYGSKTELVKVTQGSKYYLPTKAPDGSRLFGFECSNGNYYAYAEPVEVTSDLTFTAVFIQKFTLTIVINDDDTKQYTKEFGEQFSLPEPPKTNGNKIFKYWIVNDEHYQPNDFITITADMTATAFYSDEFTVRFIVGGEEEIRTCKNNDEIDLYYSGPEKVSQDSETGRDLDYWIIDDKKYLLYSKYKVTKNVDIIAHFANIDKTQKIVVTFNNPLSQDSSSARSIKSSQTMSFNYLENLTFPDGEDLFGSFGTNEETSEKIYFICWDFNGIRYKKNTKVGVTTSFDVNAVTGSKDDLIPDDPTPVITEDPTPVITENPPIQGSENPPIQGSENPPIQGSENPPIQGSENPPIQDPDQSTDSSNDANIPDDDKNKGDDNKKGSNTVMIVGIVIAVVVVIAVAVVGIFCYIKRKNTRISSSNDLINEMCVSTNDFNSDDI